MDIVSSASDIDSKLGANGLGILLAPHTLGYAAFDTKLEVGRFNARMTSARRPARTMSEPSMASRGRVRTSEPASITVCPVWSSRCPASETNRTQAGRGPEPAPGVPSDIALANAYASGARALHVIWMPAKLMLVVVQFPVPGMARKITRDEYHRMGEAGLFQSQRVELVDGRIIERAPAGPPHCSSRDELNDVFAFQLHGRARVRIQSPFVVDDGSEPEPDLVVVPLARYAKEHPSTAHLIVEVASTSLTYDRETKGPLYARSRVPEYWIVDVVTKAIEVYKTPVDGRYSSMERFDRGIVSPEAFPDVAVDVRSLFAES